MNTNKGCLKFGDNLLHDFLTLTGLKTIFRN